MSETKAALIVANWKYEDADLRQLVAPANDAEALAGVLGNPNICGFEVTTLLNRPSREACEQIERFFLDRKRDDLLLLYFSCHGIKDDDGLLYFAAPDTRLVEHSRPLRSTALSADFVRSVMRASNSRRQVLMLDCCYSGAFAGAMLSKGDKSAGVRDQFEQGRGMVVMTASDALQYSFEGENVAGQPVNSIFTRVLVRGIETGEADHDRDGTISLDELYDYVYERVVQENPNQRPKKWDLGVEGRIVVAQTPVVRSVELQPELIAAVHNSLPFVRLGAVGELTRLLNGNHKGVASAAREALEKLATDDSRQVSSAAESALGRGVAPPKPIAVGSAVTPRQAEPPIAPAQQTPPRPAAPKPKKAPEQRTPATPAPVARPAQTPRERKPVVRPQPAYVAPPSVPNKPESIPNPGDQAPVEPTPVKHSGPSYWILTGALVLALAGFLLYRAASNRKDPGQSTGQQAQTATTSAKTEEVVIPALLPAPPFDYFFDGSGAESSRIRLTQVSSEPHSPVNSEEDWLKGNDLESPALEVPNPFMQKEGAIPAQIPTKRGSDLLLNAIRNGKDLLGMYGRNFAGGRYLVSYDFNTGKVNFAFDFNNYVLPPKYRDADRNFIDEYPRWAQVKDGVLYVSTWNGTYAKSSYGLNGYLNAIDVSSGRLLWRSQPLVSNSQSFLLYKDVIVSGYGFTDEAHFIYVLNQSDGRVVQKIPVTKSVAYVLNKGDNIYVHTYADNLVFKATE